MTTRSQKRRQARSESKLDREVNGITRRQLLEAEKELQGDATGLVADPETTYGALLNDWQITEHRRESLRVQYHRVIELRNRGRRTNPEEIETEYAQVKETLELIQTQMVEFLETLEAGQVGELLSNRHFIPGAGLALRTPDRLRDLLDEALYGEEPGEAASPPASLSASEEHRA